MFKLAVFVVLVGFAAASPGLLNGGHVLAAPAVAVSAPTAVSQQSRHDIINPGVATVTTAHVAPVAVAAHPAVSVSSALSSQIDIRRPAAVAAYAAAPVATIGNLGNGNLGYGGAGLNAGGLGSAGLYAGGLGYASGPLATGGYSSGVQIGLGNAGH